MLHRTITAIIAGATAFAPAASGADLEEIHAFGSNPGALRMFRYVPASAAPSAPVILVLHGCVQGARDMYTGSGFREVADARGIVLVLPEQTTGANPSRCFNWAGEYGDPANLIRGQGENQSIVEMVRHTEMTLGTDPDAVYVTGFSGGGAMVPVLLATWPDVFAAGAVIAGVPYRCGVSVTDAFACMRPGRDRTPSEWGDLVRGASPVTDGFPRVAIWHGRDDPTVVPLNARELVDQWTDVHRTDAVADDTTTSGRHERSEFRHGGATVVQLNLVDGLAHALPNMPNDDCGAAGAFLGGAEICAAREIADFFQAQPPSPPGGEPTSTDGGTVETTADGSRARDPSNDLPSEGCDCQSASGAPLPLLLFALLVPMASRRRR